MLIRQSIKDIPSRWSSRAGSCLSLKDRVQRQDSGVLMRSAPIPLATLWTSSVIGRTIGTHGQYLEMTIAAQSFCRKGTVSNSRKTQPRERISADRERTGAFMDFRRCVSTSKRSLRSVTCRVFVVFSIPNDFESVEYYAIVLDQDVARLDIIMSNAGLVKI